MVGPLCQLPVYYIPSSLVILYLQPKNYKRDREKRGGKRKRGERNAKVKDKHTLPNFWFWFQSPKYVEVILWPSMWPSWCISRAGSYNGVASIDSGKNREAIHQAQGQWCWRNRFNFSLIFLLNFFWSSYFFRLFWAKHRKKMILYPFLIFYSHFSLFGRMFSCIPGISLFL